MAKQENSNSEQNKMFVFEKMNYILMLVGLGIMFLGYILMIGGGSNDPNAFSDKLFNFQRLTLAPILIIVGVVVEVYAILYKPKDKNKAA